MDNGAIVPENFQLSDEIHATAEQEAVQVAEQADREYAALKSSSGWQRVVQDMTADIEKFKTGGFIKDIEKKSLDEIGKLFVIHQTVATLLQGYLDKVEGAAKAVADAERSKQPK